MIGLSDYLQDQMGEITSLDLPDLGDVIRATRKMGSVESEDASSPIEALRNSVSRAGAPLQQEHEHRDAQHDQ